MQATAIKFPYRYMEYEKDFLQKEIHALFPCAIIKDEGKKVLIDNIPDSQLGELSRLTYIQSYSINGKSHYTLQGALELSDGGAVNRQHTRYSTHGMHEYKGKYNPQIVHFLLNYFNVSPSQKILDPFVGSGTTILECEHMGITAMGTDINPMACFISNAKVQSLKMKIPVAYEILNYLLETANGATEIEPIEDDARLKYLINWIPVDTLSILETIRREILRYDDCYQQFFLLIASDLIRDYSYQEPSDLRIRKRYSPFPKKSFITAFRDNSEKHLQKIESAKKVLPDFIYESTNKAFNYDIKQSGLDLEGKYDAAITSPPYVTALPYIDTQRISLVWLNLCEPQNLQSLEAALIGSRELIKQEKREWKEAIKNNNAELPMQIYEQIIMMNNSISSSDGFRKQAVPSLMYRYFSDMKKMFGNVLSVMKFGGKFGLIVGRNKTTLGGNVYNIDTPQLLSVLAEQVGWDSEEIIPLQTYKRYGINSKNAINSESLIVLRRRS